MKFTYEIDFIRQADALVDFEVWSASNNIARLWAGFSNVSSSPMLSMYQIDLPANAHGLALLKELEEKYVPNVLHNFKRAYYENEIYFSD